MTSRVVVLGSVNLDVVTEVAALPRPGQTVTAHRVRRNVGGKGANQAVAAHLLGANVTLVARVGDDPESAWLRAGLAETGLDVTAVRSVPGRASGTAYIAVAAGENTIVVDPGANHSWPGGLGPDRAAVGTAAVLVLQHEVPAELNELAVAAGRARIVLNAAPSRAVPPALLARCDPLVVNAHELVDQVGGAISEGVHAAMSALLRRGAPGVVTTLGADGAVWATATEAGQVDAVGQIGAVAVEAVDSTGAGDAFVGALAGELAGGATLPHAVRWAVGAASASVRSAGTHASYPDRAAVRALLGWS
ncbi:MAG: ribokinase [Pseudonocardia sp.]